MLLVVHSQEADPEEGPRGQVEAPARFLKRESIDLAIAYSLLHVTKVDYGHFDVQARLDDLDHLAARDRYRRAKGLVTANDLVEGTFQNGWIERALQTKTYRHIPGWITRIQAIQSPESLLSERGREDIDLARHRVPDLAFLLDHCDRCFTRYFSRATGTMVGGTHLSPCAAPLPKCARSEAIVRYLRNCAGAISIPALLALAAIWKMCKESAPSSNRLSCRPTCSRRRTSAQMAASFFSWSVRGATKSLSRAVRPVSGIGSAFRSIFPFGVTDSASIRTTADGNM